MASFFFQTKYMGIIKNILSSETVKDTLARMDDWKLTAEETLRYRLEFLKAMPTGFQLAQRLIGIMFAGVFLVMVLTTFIMSFIIDSITKQHNFITDTMGDPIMLVFGLFFGGGIINSMKGSKPEAKTRLKEMENISNSNLSRREKRRLRKNV